MYVHLIQITHVLPTLLKETERDCNASASQQVLTIQEGDNL